MAKGKVISMNEKTKEVGIEIKGKKENFKVGKKIFNGKKFEIGDTIEFELKGSNFELKKVTHNQKTYRNDNKNNNKNKLLSTKQYPYNFVSLGEEREKGERKLGENTGKLVCKLKTLSPLFIMGKKENEIEYFYRENGIYTIPASSLKGAIRNIIDTLTNSAIRNVDETKLKRRMLEVSKLRYKFILVPPEFKPSSSLEKLSFSEKLFGTTGNHHEDISEEKENKEMTSISKKLFGTTGNHHENISEEKENKEMTSMSGRVFFSDAKICNPGNPKMVKNGEAVTLKPFGEPHPTLFDFYLYKGDYDNSEFRIRGRKFYWHHKDKIDNDYENFGRSIEAEKRKTNSSIELMDSGNEFEFEIYFERLTDEELGVLIYALELEENMAHKIGKGKAFGFGSSKIIIEEFLFENKEKKYKCFSKEEIYESQKKEKFLRIAKEKYITEEENIKELKKILDIKNDLDFSESPFPEETGKTKGKNTLNWFMNNKGIKLLKILDELDEKKNDNK